MKISLLALFTVLSLGSFAQKKNKHWQKVTMLSTVNAGISFQKFDGLNNRIAAFPQYKQLRDYMGTLTLGSMMVKNNFISGLSLTGGSSFSGDRDKKSSALQFIAGQFNIGYDFIPGDKLMLFPLVGVGFEGYQAKFYKDNSGVDFDDVLNFPGVQNSVRPVKFTNKFATYNLGFGFTVRPDKCKGSIGIQAAYTGSFKDKSWKSSDYQELANAPVDKLSRFQVSLLFTDMQNNRR